MRNSAQKARLYHADAPASSAPSTFIAAEQRLRFGHAFHGTSKASEGFTQDDLRRYAPEFGTAFPLHYLAVANEHFASHSAGHGPLPIDPEVMAFAAPCCATASIGCCPATRGKLGTCCSNPPSAH